MVRFFNQKEEVISVELTPYGKERFANGTFSPAHYAFYDTTILYDGQYANITETQNQIVNRISTETPRLRPSTRFRSTPGAVYSLTTSNSRNQFSQNNLSNGAFARALGNSDPNSIYAPAWDVKVLDLSTCGLNPGVAYNMGNSIPQVSASLYIDYESLGTTSEDAPLGLTLMSSDSIFLDLVELNTVFKSNGNFDIEVYKSGSDGELLSLGFINDSRHEEILKSQTDPSVLASNIEGTNHQILRNFPKLDSNYVEFYLDISADSEIHFASINTNSTLYKRNVDNTPQDPCDVLDLASDGYDA